MIVCKVCGTENEQGAGFCGSCGAFLEWSGEAVAADATVVDATAAARTPPDPTLGMPAQPAAPVPPLPAAAASLAAPMDPGAIICPACGEANEPTRVFCRRCATELAPAATGTSPVVAEPPRARSIPPVALLGGLAGAIVLGVLAVIFLLPKGAPNQPARVSPSAPTAGVTNAPASGASGSLGLPTQPPPTSAPPAACTSERGLIVFTTFKDKNADLWVWDATDGSVRKLVTASGGQSDPSWSPGDTTVVYSSPDGLRMVLANGKPAKVPDFTHHAEDRNAAWSPAGDVVVFATNRKPLTSLDIMSRPADDNQAPLKALANSKADDWDPAFSPDGSRIAFVSRRNGDARLFLMDVDGGNQAEIQLGDGIFDDPSISPDGEWIAFTRRDAAGAQKDLYKARVDGSDMTRLTNTDVSENDMAWSPDGGCIAVARADTDARLVLVDAGTGADVARIGVKGAQNGQPDWR